MAKLPHVGVLSAKDVYESNLYKKSIYESEKTYKKKLQEKKKNIGDRSKNFFDGNRSKVLNSKASVKILKQKKSKKQKPSDIKQNLKVSTSSTKMPANVNMQKKTEVLNGQTKSVTNKVVKYKKAKVANGSVDHSVNDKSNEHNEIISVKRERSENTTEMIDIEPTADSQPLKTLNMRDYVISSCKRRKTKFEKIKVTNNIPSPNFLLSTEERGKQCLEWVLSPITVDEFFKNHWEKAPLLLQRHNSDYYKGIISTADIDKMLRQHTLLYTKNLDITSYQDGKRQTHNLEGRANAAKVWEFYNEGCSVRLLNPQTFNKSVCRLLAILQEYFNSFCGANIYLTPPSTQGFAPHWDDIEAFVIQLEGAKRWRVYAPRAPLEALPQESSGNFGPSDDLGEPLIDCVLKAGDLLYFPRGFIHQGNTLDSVHSMHITLSTYQKNAWCNLLSHLLPLALHKATQNDVGLRQGLPRDLLDTVGCLHRGRNEKRRSEIKEKVQNLVSSLISNLPLDEAVDEMAKDLVHTALPPQLGREERVRSVHEGAETWCSDTNCAVNRVEFDPHSKIRLVTKNCVRLSQTASNDSFESDSEIVNLYYSVENSLEYKQEELQYLQIETALTPALELLVKSYPKFVTVEELPLETLEDKMDFTYGLWERGILMNEEPLQGEIL